jgi:hypothetical protein
VGPVFSVMTATIPRFSAGEELAQTSGVGCEEMVLVVIGERSEHLFVFPTV